MTDNKSPKTILITGCSSGIGYCAAVHLRTRGYRVFATARKQRDVDELIAQGFESVRLDLANSDSIRAAVSEILTRMQGSLYALFNNGAYGQPGAVEDLSRDALRAQFETNFFGTHELTTLIIPVMRKQGFGRIVQNSSLLGYVALRNRGAYNASKFALEGLSDTLRLELRDTNIHVSIIEPGPITSKFRQNAYQAFVTYIDAPNSPHQTAYAKMQERLEKAGPAAPFTLPPEAVVKKLIHALEKPHPKLRYRVTFPAYLFATLNRLIPDRIHDRILYKIH